MNKLLADIFGKILAAFGFYALGRKSQQNKDLKEDVATGEKEIDILEEQRDNDVHSVDDADAHWMRRDEGKKD